MKQTHSDRTSIRCNELLYNATLAKPDRISPIFYLTNQTLQSVKAIAPT